MNAGKLFGRSIAFPPRVGPDGRWAWSEGADNVRESIRIILLTDENERLMLSGFGGGLRRFLFEPNTVSVRRSIQSRIQGALRLWEARVAVEAVDVVEDPANPQAVIATIHYHLVATRDRGQVSLSVSLGA
ncbi:MAG: GPW/gp25 family protein [Chloroflexi bacterium]|nr:GPW/gp25 family protein [Chloroflexota bacterium]